MGAAVDAAAGHNPGGGPMVKERENWIFHVLVALLIAGMALTLHFGPAQSNHSGVVD